MAAQWYGDGRAVMNVGLQRDLVVEANQFGGISGIIEEVRKRATFRCLAEAAEYSDLELLDSSALGACRLSRDEKLLGGGEGNGSWPF